MAKLRDIEIPFEKVVALVHGLSPAEKRRLLMKISSDDAYWKDLCTFSRKLAKRKEYRTALISAAVTGKIDVREDTVTHITTALGGSDQQWT